MVPQLWVLLFAAVAPALGWLQASAAPDWARSSTPHVLLIGRPLVGKTTLGKEMGRRLGVPFLDADEVRGGVATDEDFDVKLLLNWIGMQGQRVVACGGYAAMLPRVVRVLERAKTLGHIVVHIQREVGEEAKAAGCEGDIRRALAEEMRSSGSILEERYSRARTHQFYVPQAPEDSGFVQQGCVQGADELFAMLARLMEAESPDMGLPRGGSIASITAPTVIGHGLDCVWAQQQGAAAVELRVDLLRGCPKREYAMVRKACSLPILWTVRSQSQGGAFRGTGEEYAALVHLGAELGADLIDVECVWPADLQDRCITRRRASKVVSTYIDTDARWYSSGEIAMTLQLMATSFDGHNHCVHFSVSPIPGQEEGQAAEMENALALHSGRCNMPAIGSCGRGSALVRNSFLTWTSVPLLENDPAVSSTSQGPAGPPGVAGAAGTQGLGGIPITGPAGAPGPQGGAGASVKCGTPLF